MSAYSARYPSLDHWRGFACLAVVAYHANSLSPGLASAATLLLDRLWCGVPIFFVISGYCIAASADTSSRRSLGAGQFFAKRFRRIYPPYWAMLLVLFALWVAFPLRLSSEPYSFVAPWELTPSQWLGTITLSETWLCHVNGARRTMLLGPGWSLCYEEQFYAMAGLFLMAPRWLLFPAFAALTAVAAVLQLTVGVPVGVFLDPYWYAFAAGVLVYWALARASTRWCQRCLWLLAFATLVSLWPCRHVLRYHHATPGGGAAIGLAFATLLVGLRSWDGWINKSWYLVPLRWWGVRCYALYLAHWPIMKVVSTFLAGVSPVLTFVACVAASLLAGWAFHAVVERQFLPGSAHAEAPRPDGSGERSPAGGLATDAPRGAADGGVAVAVIAPPSTVTG